MFATIKDFLVNLASSGPQRAHIDLLLAQLSAAEKKIVDTDRRLSDALIKAGLLETELEELRSQLPNQTPVPEISSNTVSVIKAIYSFRGRADSTSISRTTGIPPEDVEYHFGVLKKAGFIQVIPPVRMAHRETPMSADILDAGRTYAVEVLRNLGIARR